MKILFKLIFFVFVCQLAISSSLKIKFKRQLNNLIEEKLTNKRVVSWWNHRLLTWTLIGHPLTLNWTETLNAFEKAFSFWSRISSLKFKTSCNLNGCLIKNSMPDINIQFIDADEHDYMCKYHFSQSTLAHAFYPNVGIAHFNKEKNWTIGHSDNKSQFNLIASATHEIGHLLGFEHSSNRDSIMYWQYKSDEKDIKFHKEDIDLVELVYGKLNSRNRFRNKYNFNNRFD